MSDTPAFSHTADGLLRILVRRGEIMTDAVLIYRDIDVDIDDGSPLKNHPRRLSRGHSRILVM